MRLFILISLAVMVAVGTLAACNSSETLLSQTPGNSSQNPQQSPTPADNARRISVEDLHKLWEKGDVLIIDTRADSAYKESHIKGAISMPTGTVLSRIDELPRNKMIVAYCT